MFCLNDVFLVPYASLFFQDLANLSKKVDWDLKRIIEKPVHKLERRTQRAIAELIRESLFMSCLIMF